MKWEIVFYQKWKTRKKSANSKIFIWSSYRKNAYIFKISSEIKSYNNYCYSFIYFRNIYNYGCLLIYFVHFCSFSHPEALGKLYPYLLCRWEWYHANDPVCSYTQWLLPWGRFNKCFCICNKMIFKKVSRETYRVCLPEEQQFIFKILKYEIWHYSLWYSHPHIDRNFTSTCPITVFNNEPVTIPYWKL